LVFQVLFIGIPLPVLPVFWTYKVIVTPIYRMMFETLEDYAFGTLLMTFLDDFIFEECIQMMWCIRTNGISLSEIYNVDPIESFFEQERLQAGNDANQQSGSNGGSSAASSSVNCPVCNELVSGRRFAPHLEKCMNGGKRGSKRHYDYIHDSSSAKNARASNVTKSVEPIGSSSSLVPQSTREVVRPTNRAIGGGKSVVDCFPNSLVVRIKVKNGVPRGNTCRMGASLEEFQQQQLSQLPST